MDTRLSEEERSVRWVYWWLLWSSLITVPWMLNNVFSYRYVQVMDVLWPVSLHLVVLPWRLRAENLYVRRHTQQAVLLVTARALAAVFFIVLLDAFGFWILVSGSLWLGGTIWGIRQINRGDCWLMRRRGESAQLPNNRPVLTEQVPDVASDPLVHRPSGPDERSRWPQRMAYGDSLGRQNRRADARAVYLDIFRHGDPDHRGRAIEALEKLDEVELF